MQKFYKPLLFCISLVPFGSVIYNGFTNNLTANPIEYITHFTGDWTIYFLLITLSITPLRNLTRNSLIRYRRMIGLFAFFYACLHFITYFAVDQFFDFSAILEDIVDRPYITVGFTAFVLLIPLTITSTKKMVARLGNKWRTLHTSIYLITGLCIIHYYWLVKSDVRIPLLLATIYILLMSLRLKWAKNVMKLRFLNIRSA